MHCHQGRGLACGHHQGSWSLQSGVLEWFQSFRSEAHPPLLKVEAGAEWSLLQFLEPLVSCAGVVPRTSGDELHCHCRGYWGLGCSPCCWAGWAGGAAAGAGGCGSWSLQSWELQQFLAPPGAQATLVPGAYSLGSCCCCFPDSTASTRSRPLTFRCIDVWTSQVSWCAMRKILYWFMNILPVVT